MNAHITILNLDRLEDYETACLQPNMTTVVGNGMCLPYGDQEFDIVFSNSVIEHVSTLENQRAFASEARRVGRGYWIQTPAHEFPIEPHYWAPFIHWYPKRVQKHLLRNFTLWGLMGRPSDRFIEMAIAELRLMKRAEVAAFFPDGEIWIERVLGLPKSYTAYRLPVPKRTSIPAPPRIVMPAAAAEPVAA